MGQGSRPLVNHAVSHSGWAQDVTMLLLPVLTTGESWPAVAYILCYRPADAGSVLWLRWAGRTNCDMTVIVVAGYGVPTGTDLAHPPPGWACTGTLAAAAVHLEPGALPQRWQHASVPVSRCGPSTLGSRTPASSSPRLQNPSAKILQDWARAQPKIPRERGGLGVRVRLCPSPCC